MARRPHPTRPNVSSPISFEPEVELIQHAELIDEIKETADKLARDGATRGDLKILSRAMRELQYAFKIFTPFRRHRKVSVFGSARTKPDAAEYKQAVDFGRRMSHEGWMVVTGAGGGIMEAAHVGAGRQMSMGLNIMLPFEQEANPIIAGDPKLVNMKYFFTRKLMFVKEVHAIVVCPGGFGTQDEAFETLTLIQTGKRDLMPFVLLEPPGTTYWRSWMDYVKTQLLGNGMISPGDLSLFKVTSDVEEAVDEVLGFYSVYNSMRYVRDKLVLRLHVEPPDEFVARLNSEFADIIESGEISKVAVHRFEMDDEHLKDLPRLSFKFNRMAHGRLREMINLINEELEDLTDDESDQAVE